jgi:hypothetical protein
MFVQKLSELQPEGIVGTVGVLRSAEENQHERLALVDHLALRIFLKERSKELDLLLEGGLAVEVFV